jgi:hypothetical protein
MRERRLKKRIPARKPDRFFRRRDRLLELPLLLVNPAQVEMRAGEAGIERHGQPQLFGGGLILPRLKQRPAHATVDDQRERIEFPRAFHGEDGFVRAL